MSTVHNPSSAAAVNLRDLGCDSFSAKPRIGQRPMGPLEAGIHFVDAAERIGSVWPSIDSAGWSDELKGRQEVRGRWPAG